MKSSRTPPPARSPGKYVLRLFVAGATALSREAVLRVRHLCETELGKNCKLEVIDIYQQPQMARDHQIVATPTLIKELPRPVRRFIGNLLNMDGLLVDLDLGAKRKIEV
jgi:circadian clock protein KaiB